MSDISGSAFINGKPQKLSDAMIPITDRGFLYGHSVFETLLILNQKAVAWDDHMQRLDQSCIQAKISPPDFASLRQDAMNLIDYSFNQSSKTNHKMQLRIIVTGGNKIQFAIRNHLQTKISPCNVYLICRPTDATQSIFSDGIKLFLTPDLRGKGLINVKSSNYLQSLIALDSAMVQNYNDALYYNEHNEITESTTSNFIWLDEDNHLFTAPSQNQCLAGTTLILLNKCVLALQNRQIVFQSLHKNFLNKAKGAALVSSVRGLVPVKSIDNHNFDLSETKILLAELNSKLVLEQIKSASSF